MLTVLHPNLMPMIRQLPGGLLPLHISGEVRPTLVVKVPKEYILTAKINASFKIYLIPVKVKGQTTYGVITAFFDDADEPLTLKTPLFADDLPKVLFDGLRKGKINVHFFDELARERLVYRASVTIPDAAQQVIDGMPLLEASMPNARAIMDGIDTNFGLRTAADDVSAITVSLDESVYGEDLFIQDLRPEKHAYHGSRGFTHTILEREEPGSFQEEDIIQCLLMIFPADQIYFNPKRTYDEEEICDILIITDSRIFIIQAKDSPNIERISRQKLSRKRANVISALKKAIEQIKGAIGYCHRNGTTLKMVIGDEQVLIDIKGLELKALIIVKELFADQFKEYSPILLDMVKSKKVSCIALDYPELHKYCTHLESELGFFEAYDKVMAYAEHHGEYPRLRFGMAGN